MRNILLMTDPVSATFILRMMVYAVLFTGFVELQFVNALVCGRQAMYGENSFVEISQLAFLTSTLTGLLGAAVHFTKQRALAISVGGFLFLFIVRELDYYFDCFIGDGVWQIVASMTTLLLGIYALRHRVSIKSALTQFQSHYSFGMFTAGMLVTLVYSRLLGQGRVWQAVMGETYIRVVQRMVEECTEFAGYFLIWAAVVEWIITQRRIRLEAERKVEA